MFVKKKSYTTFAAIHLGSEMISMQIVEYRNMNKVKVIEQCNHRVKLGEETFKNKIIPFSMVSEICELLQGYKTPDVRIWCGRMQCAGNDRCA